MFRKLKNNRGTYISFPSGHDGVKEYAWCKCHMKLLENLCTWPMDFIYLLNLFETEPAGELPVILIRRRKARGLKNYIEVSTQLKRKKHTRKKTHTLPMRCARCFAPAIVHIIYLLNQSSNEKKISSCEEWRRSWQEVLPLSTLSW